MDALVAFAAALVALRLAGALARRWRVSRRPELAAWAWSLAAYAVAAAAIAWGEAAQWDARTFRVYYAAGRAADGAAARRRLAAPRRSPAGRGDRPRVRGTGDRRGDRDAGPRPLPRPRDPARPGSPRLRAGPSARDRRERARHDRRRRRRARAPSVAGRSEMPSSSPASSSPPRAAGSRGSAPPEPRSASPWASACSTRDSWPRRRLRCAAPPLRPLEAIFTKRGLRRCPYPCGRKRIAAPSGAGLGPTNARSVQRASESLGGDSFCGVPYWPAPACSRSRAPRRRQRFPEQQQTARWPGARRSPVSVARSRSTSARPGTGSG